MKMMMVGIFAMNTFNCFAQNNADTLKTLRAPNLSQVKSPVRIDLKTLPANYATRHIAFFCRQELKLEKITTIPILIRVGSIADCNYLEQKPGYNIR